MMIKGRNYDLKAVNPNRKSEEHKRTPGQLLDIIEGRAKRSPTQSPPFVRL
jgi:hypothetical protein